MFGDKTDVKIGNGNDNSILMVGNYGKLNVGNGNNKLGFWGDNFTAKFGNGNNIIRTLDWSFKNNEFTSWADYYANNFVTYWIDEATNKVKGTIKGLNNTNINLGTGSNMINLTIGTDLNLVGVDEEDVK